MCARIIYCIFLLSITSFKRIQNAKVGDKCTISHTTLTGTCRKMEDCIPAKQDFDLDGIQPTLCELDYYDSNHVFFCCQDVVETTTTTTQSPTTPTEEIENTNKRISERKCEEYNRNATEFIEQVNLDQFVDPLSGSEAQLNEFPHMAQIWILHETDSLKYICAGVLISPRFVVGVAQCAQKKESYIEPSKPYAVKLGDLYLSRKVRDDADPIQEQYKIKQSEVNWNPKVEDGAKGLWVRIDKIHFYNDNLWVITEDIMLVELEREVPLSDAIRPACLWQTNSVGDFQQAVVSGWHLVHPNFAVKNLRLKKIVIYIYSNEECIEMWSNYTRNRKQTVTSLQICAGDSRGTKYTCNGDSGAPLQVKICKKKCLNYVIGLTSLGPRCGLNAPVVYTRVSGFLNWIESIVWPET